jgi:hypothetical protein
MNSTQIKCLSVFAIFAIIGFGPISPGCLMGMYIVLFRPLWFWTVTVNLYTNKPVPQTSIGTVSVIQTQQIRKKCFLSILGLFILDIAPVPVTPVVAFVIILSRPRWFYRLVTNVYGKDSNTLQDN